MAIAAADHELVKNKSVSLSNMESYLEKYGTGPSWHWSPEGKPMVGSQRVADDLGIDYQGSYRSTAGTDTGTGSIYLPPEIEEQARISGASAGNIAGYYDRAGVLGSMQTANAPAEGFAPQVGERAGPTGTRDLLRQRYPIGMAPSSSVPSERAAEVSDFRDWYGGNQPSTNPYLSQYGISEPRTYETDQGERGVLPGSLMRHGYTTDYTNQYPHLAAAQIQQGQLGDPGVNPTGPFSPFIPPHLLTEQGYGGGDVLGGRFGPGQAAGQAGETFLNDDLTAQYPPGEFSPQPQPGSPPYSNLPPGAPPGGVPPDRGPVHVDPSGPLGLGGVPGGEYPPPTSDTTPTGGQLLGGIPPAGPPIQALYGAGSVAGGLYGTGQGVAPTTGVGAGGDPNAGIYGQGAPQSGNVDDFMGSSYGDIGYLRGMAENAGYPTDVTPAWKAAVAAQQQNIERRQADLAANFDVMGGRFSTAYGDEMGQFQEQIAMSQNAMLMQAQQQSLEAARSREYGAGQALGGMATQNLGQLSSQDFQSQMQGEQYAFQTLQRMMGDSAQASQLMNQFGAQGAMALMQSSMDAVNALYGGEIGGSAQEQGQFIGAAGDISQLWRQNLLAGTQIGSEQYGIMQDQRNRDFEEWLRIQPQYDPLLPYYHGGVTQSQPQYIPGYRPSAWLSVLNAAAGIGSSLLSGGMLRGSGTPNVPAQVKAV